MDSKSLKEAGLKATLPRIRILEILEASEQKHVSAEDVYKALLDAGEDVGLATVYRVLTQFEDRRSGNSSSFRFRSFRV